MDVIAWKADKGVVDLRRSGQPCEAGGGAKPLSLAKGHDYLNSLLLP